MKPSDIERFWSKVDRSGGPDACHPWLGGKRNRYGHGDFRLDGRNDLAHRVAYRIVVGPIPEGLVLDHVVCDNPPCCNPRHTTPTTNAANVLRGGSPPAVNARKTHCVSGHPLSGDNLIRSSNGRRRCKECSRARWRKYSDAHPGAWRRSSVSRLWSGSRTSTRKEGVDGQ